MLAEYVPYLIIGLVAAALIAVTIVFARLAWRRQVRRYIVALVGRREAIMASLKAIDGVLAGLASGSVDDVLAFAHSESEERRVIAEIATRMRIQGGELAELPLPKKLWPLADLLDEAVAAIGSSAAAVGEAEGDAVLDALGALDLKPPRTALADAEAEIVRLAEVYDLTDPSVYGGGLYI
ncbi:MAG: hypothetical protein Q7W44_02930 [Coriobacteriia bacterium]|nr:hypothetical protein [Coriobacteriia bacterium]